MRGNAQHYDPDRPVLNAHLPQLDELRDSDRGEESRIKVLMTAERLFAVKGFRMTSIADIVRESGVSTGSIYHHFGDKSGIRHALREWYTAEISRSAREVMRSREHETPYIALMWAIGAFWRWVHTHRHAARLLLIVADPIEFGSIAPSSASHWQPFIAQCLSASGFTQVNGYGLIVRGAISTGAMKILRSPEGSDIEPLIGELLAVLTEIGADAANLTNPSSPPPT